MKQYPSKEKIVNTKDDHGTGQIATPFSKKTFTGEDLKGKKVDGDPELESDQPVDQLH